MKGRRMAAAVLLTTIFLPLVTKNYVGCSPPPEVQAAVETRGVPWVKTAVASWTGTPEPGAKTPLGGVLSAEETAYPAP